MPTSSSTGFVLLVDDDEGFRELISAVLRQRGYTVRCAASGEDALKIVLTGRPGLALLDVHLGGLSGYDVCRELRARFGKKLPIVFVSGERTEPFDQVAGLRLGADDYLLKPVDPGELLARVDRLIDPKAATGDEAPAPDIHEAPFGLTRREVEVLEALAGGLRPKEIARELSISSKTVATHIQNILSKLDVHSQGQAIAVALQGALVGAKTHGNAMHEHSSLSR